MNIPFLAVIAYAVISRLAYVGWVGTALWQQDLYNTFTRLDGIEAGFQKFRRRAAILMWNDALSIILVCAVTRDTLDVGIPRAVELAIAAGLILIGLGTKMWAARTLGDKAYYWYNFFSPGIHAPPNPPGPYRFMNNPMYTVGYLHAYGLALAVDSLPGLAIALFDQVAILMFHELVERPHYERLTRGRR